MVKKLRNHLASSTANLRKTTSLVTKYSSGEDSDTTDNINKKVDGTAKTRRTTRLTVSGSPNYGSGSQQQKTTTPLPPLFNSYSQPLPSKTYVPSLAATKTTAAATTPFNRSGNTSSSKNVYVSPVIINDSEDDDIDWNLKRSRSNISSSSSNSSKLNQTRNNNSSSVNNSFDSMLRNLNGSNGYERKEDDEDDANTTSDYTKRLLQFREGNMQKVQSNMRKRPIFTNQRTTEYQALNENDIVYHAESFLETAHVPLNTAIKNFINRLDAAYGLKQTFVPMVLVTFVIIFFSLIIFMYITISPDIQNSLTPSTTMFVICDVQHENEASFACIDEQNVVPSLNLLKVLAAELQQRAVAHRCERSKLSSSVSVETSNIMCLKDFWHFLNDNQQHGSSKHIQEHSSVLDVMKDVHNIEYLIDRNKQWGIQNVDSNGAIKTLDQVVNLRAHQAECFAILSPKLPLKCTLYKKLQAFFTIIGTLAIVGIVIFVVRKGFHYVLQMKEKRRAQVNQIVNEIVRTLMEKTVMDKENAFLVVNHMRDKIIEPGKKSELSWAWNEAITYLEKNDSRIHFGFENINGEDFKVIRWIDDVKNLTGNSFNQQKLSQQHQLQQQQQQSSQRFSTVRYSTQQQQQLPDARLKKWMCPAFDKSNKIKDPPTNCLKIRQMFDKYEINSSNLQSIIQDTILHKVCDKGCKIFDIQLDLKTCCTYVKCATSEDAGIIHEEINGWWLDNRLVVVKFLKLDKYHQRFPSSINACTTLYPSSNSYSSSMGNNYSAGTNNGHDFEDDMDDDENDDFE